MRQVNPEKLKGFNKCISMFLQNDDLSSESLKALLKNEIGVSRHSEFFCNSIGAILSSEAKENVMKSLEKSGLTKTGAYVSACFILSKDNFAFGVHFTS